MPSYRILGYDMQHVRVYLNEGEMIYGEGGHLVAKSPTVKINYAAQGGIIKSLERELTGSRFFIMQVYGPGIAEFSSFLPGRIVKIDLNGNGIMVEHNSFLFAEQGVQYSATLNKISVGWLGGEGLLMAHFSGQGSVFVHALGGVSSFVLRPGEEIEVEEGHLLAFDDSMQYSVTRAGGIKTMLLGHIEKEGAFFIKLTGPGRVWLHNVSLSQLIAKLNLMVGGNAGPAQPQGPSIDFQNLDIRL